MAISIEQLSSALSPYRFWPFLCNSDQVDFVHSQPTCVWLFDVNLFIYIYICIVFILHIIIVYILTLLHFSGHKAGLNLRSRERKKVFSSWGLICYDDQYYLLNMASFNKTFVWKGIKESRRAGVVMLGWSPSWTIEIGRTRESFNSVVEHT